MPACHSIRLSTKNENAGTIKPPLHVVDWKLVVRGQGLKAKCELFDPSADPAEKANLVAKHPKLVEELTKLLAAEEAKDVDALPTDD